MWKAFQQIQTYKEQIADVFQYAHRVELAPPEYSSQIARYQVRNAQHCTLDEARAVREEVAFFQAFLAEVRNLPERREPAKEPAKSIGQPARACKPKSAQPHVF